MKFCRDCEYYRPARSLAHRSRVVTMPASCWPPPVLRQDIVTGQLVPLDPRKARAVAGVCGPEAQLFSPRQEVPPQPSLLARLRARFGL